METNKEMKIKLFTCKECGGSGEILYTYGWGLHSTYGPEQDIKSCEKCLGTGKSGFLKYAFYLYNKTFMKVYWFKYNLIHKSGKPSKQDIDLPF